MRAIVGLALAFGLATSATADENQISVVIPVPGQQGGNNSPGTGLSTFPLDPGGYGAELAQLKRRMERLTRKDGGRLTPAHQASLQRDLNALNRRYHDHWAGTF
jgi:hypothetical protein